MLHFKGEMAKKSSKRSTTPSPPTSDQPSAGQSAAAPSEQPSLLTRVAAAAVTSYLAEKIWSNRHVVSALWVGDAQAAEENGMLRTLEYFSSMGALFAVGIIVGVVTTRGAAFLQRYI